MSQKTVYLLNIDGYAPEITAITYPLIARYATKIGAMVCEIRERRWPAMPVTYEKLQIRELAQKHGDDWSIYIDSDALVHPDCPDFSELVGADTVLHNGSDMSLCRFKPDRYFRRDGRHLGSCNWFTISSGWTRDDLYAPLDIPLEEAIANITPTLAEAAFGITADHLIDDYVLSRNIARYGLHFTTVQEILARELLSSHAFFWHTHMLSVDEKVAAMESVLSEDWGVVMSRAGDVRALEWVDSLTGPA